MKIIKLLSIFSFAILIGCADSEKEKKEDKGENKIQLSEKEKEQWREKGRDTVETTAGTVILPAPYHTESAVKQSKVIGWPEGKMPIAPNGFKVFKFAGKFENPRCTYIGPNDDIFVVESNTKNSADRITILRDADGDNLPELRNIFLDGLNQPYGMLILGDYFYVANTDGVYRYPYTEGMERIVAEGEKILDLPAGGYNHHWTRNLIASPNGEKIYVSVGSASNVGEYGLKEEERRAAILEINPDGSGEKIYASGLRNPVGMDFQPETRELWAAVNERDKIGDGLVPDYITSVKEGGFYGWPFSYFGNIIDPRWEDDPHMYKVENAIVPDVSVGAHTASLGLKFYDTTFFPDKYINGAFVGQHGSWNRSDFAGYKVIFVPFNQGKPQQPEDFLTGFIADEAAGEVYGRPTCINILPDGSLLVNDDSGNTLWRVSYE